MTWPIVKLDDVFEISRGGSPRPIRDYITDDPDGINWIMIGDASASSKYIETTKQKIKPSGKNKSREVKPGDFLLTNSMSFGRPYIMRTHGCIHDGWLLLRPKNSNVDQNFFYHLIGSPEMYARFAARAPGATVKNLNSGIVKEAAVPLPPIEDQKKIAAILDCADELKRLRHCGLAHLKSLSQSIFHEMFGDPVHNDRKWKVEKLGDLTTKISSGSTPKGGSENYVDGGIVFLRSQNVWRNRIELDDVVYIDEDTHQKMKKSSLKHGDILITKTGRINTENSSLGRAAMFLGKDDSANVNGHVYLVRPKPDVFKEFILYIMTMPEYREYIRGVCVGGIDKRQINKEHLEEFPIIYPPIEKQKEFLKKLKAIEKQKARFNEQLKLAETLFLSLQQRAFRGEL